MRSLKCSAQAPSEFDRELYVRAPQKHVNIALVGMVGLIPINMPHRDNSKIHPDSSAASGSLLLESSCDKMDRCSAETFSSGVMRWLCPPRTSPQQIHPIIDYKESSVFDYPLLEGAVKYKPPSLWKHVSAGPRKDDVFHIATPVGDNLEETELHISNPMITDLNYLYIPNVAISSRLVDITLVLESTADLEAFVASLWVPKQSVVRSLAISTVDSSVVISDEAMRALFAVLASPSCETLRLQRLAVEFVDLRGVAGELCALVRDQKRLRKLELDSNGLGDKAVQDLVWSCMVNPALHVVVLSGQAVTANNVYAMEGRVIEKRPDMQLLVCLF